MTSAVALQPTTMRRATTAPLTVPPGPVAPRRPPLRVLEGGRGPRRLARQQVYRRRRLVALVLLVATVAALVLLANAVLAGAAGGGTPSSAAGTSSAGAHVVQPGETLWSIARDLDPGADVRVTVDRLVRLNGGAPLQVGQRLVLP